MKYRDAASFRQALDAHLGRQSVLEGVDRVRLQRRLAFERFLVRLFQVGVDGWVLKGGYALELRLGQRARATKDLDFNAPAGPPSSILEVLQMAAEVDVGDFFRFSVAPANPATLVGPPLGGYRFRIEARLDSNRSYATFLLDVGQGDVLMNPSEALEGQVNLEFAGVPTPSFPSCPLPEHFAEKLHAYTRPRSERTRVKDLVDLLLLIEVLHLEANPALHDVVNAVFSRYATHALPAPWDVPPPPQAWQEPFRTMAFELGLSVVDALEAHRRLVVFLERAPAGG